jgi:hypothetical protein
MVEKHGIALAAVFGRTVAAPSLAVLMLKVTGDGRRQRSRVLTLHNKPSIAFTAGLQS